MFITNWEMFISECNTWQCYLHSWGFWHLGMHIAYAVALEKFPSESKLSVSSHEGYYVYLSSL
jgi:hypothetical protein